MRQNQNHSTGEKNLEKKISGEKNLEMHCPVMYIPDKGCGEVYPGQLTSLF